MLTRHHRGGCPGRAHRMGSKWGGSEKKGRKAPSQGVFSALNRASLERHTTPAALHLVLASPNIHLNRTDHTRAPTGPPLRGEPKLKTFIPPLGALPVGAPLGHCASRRVHKAFLTHHHRRPRKLKCVDALYSRSSVSDAFWHTYNFLQGAGRGVPALKFRFCRRSVIFAAPSWAGGVPANPRPRKTHNRLKDPRPPTLTDCGQGWASHRSAPSWVPPVMDPSGSYQETGWEGSTGTSSWTLFTSPKDLLGIAAGDCASMMCRALQQSSLTQSRVCFPLSCHTRCVSEKSRYAPLAGGNLCFVAPTSHSAEGKLQHPRGGKRFHRLVPKKGHAFSFG
ncbi:hypothetical protein GWK47_050401 [Chionoecetes opilio]|uniref:Uncharacterized protein n=1 Tax=Chionoecetes opilio TaxID=41210 RepID=A0A8J4Y8D9_CHIOP|nr:hypothetical protein GWK47_050401 [Chionoecetes opilio]